ncbi:MAG: SufD family Fe-S cluster assembly protein [Candidatus Omnitrophica bacterium]|nr:SufD family Fe-S cluster assembly protein [Candidatus Omnitrophota bacterium]
MDCVEIIQGNVQAKAIPIVNVTNEFAKVTHEAAIGRIDKKASRNIDESWLRRGRGN